VYLANALVPEDARVSVSAQRRDGDQRELTIDHSARAQLTRSTAAWLLVSLAAALVAMWFTVSIAVDHPADRRR
jgi:hypothetical protein